MSFEIDTEHMDRIQTLVSFFLLGLFLGGFFNVVVWRLFALIGLKEKSRCQSCRRYLPAFDQIPLVSYWLLGGRCRYCQKPISLQYPVIELLSALCFTLYADKILFQTAFSGSFFAGLTLVLGLYLIAIFIITIASDFRYSLIYDWVIIPALPFTFAASVILGTPIGSIALALLVAVVFFGGQAYFSEERWLGQGDVKFSLLLAIAFGFKPFLYIIAMAYLLGSVTSVFLIITKKRKLSGALPFGVFLGAAGLICLIFGVNWLDKLLGL
ncbi:MAG: prepilin peptidase [bacterium]